MRKFIFASFFVAFVVSCGEQGPSGGSSGSVASPIVGNLSQLIIPSDATAPAFKNFSLDFFSWDAWARGANVPTSSGAVVVGSASVNCATSGCAFNSGRISLAGTGNGIFASTRSSDPLWLSTTSLIVSPNQIQQASRLGSQITAFASAYVLPSSALTSWAGQLGLDSNTLLERGVCLAFIWSTTQSSGDIIPGVAGATVSLAGTSGAELAFPNDAYTALNNRQTNAHGAVLIVGPQNPNGDAPSVLPLNISYAAAKKYPNPTAVVRPGTVTVMPILPQAQ